MIHERRFVVNGRGLECPDYYQGTREPAPPGLWVALTVFFKSGYQLFLGIQQSTDGSHWEVLDDPRECSLGWQSFCVWPKPGRQLRLAFWTDRGRHAIVDFQVFDNGRSARA